MSEEGSTRTSRLRPPRVAQAEETHRVTTFELLFDLVFVFAFTQVTEHQIHEPTWHGALEALVMLGLLWWMWTGYAWLGNQARADESVVRLGMVLALILVFVIALVMPLAFEDTEQGLNAALVLVIAYILVRALHLGLYALAAIGDRGLMRQIVVFGWPGAACSVLLVIGAFVDAENRVWWWGAALALDIAITWTTAHGGQWRIHSASHWAERHGLIVILALGESVVAVGVGAGALELTGALLTAAVLGVLIPVALWWLYFDYLAPKSEHVLSQLRGAERVEVARDAYSYLHFLLVAGIVTTAVGIEEALAHAGSHESLGTFATLCLLGGAALYLLGHVAFIARVHGKVAWPRVATAALLLLLVAPVSNLGPIPALVVAWAVLTGLCAFETTAYADKRRLVRDLAHEAADGSESHG